MRILQITHQFPPEVLGGAELYAYRLGRALQGAGHDVAIAHPVDESGRPEYEVSERTFERFSLFTLNVRRTGRFRTSRTLRFSLNPSRSYQDRRIEDAFQSVLDRARPDLVHVHQLWSLSIGLLGRIHAQGIPLVMTLHDPWLICWNGTKMQGWLVPCSATPHCGARCLEYLIEQRLNLAPAYSESERNTWRQQLTLRIMRGWLRLIRGVLSHQVELRRQRVLAQLSPVDRFLAPSQFLKRAYVSFGLDPARIDCVTFGLDTPRKIPLDGRRRDGVVRFGFLGRWVPGKGLHLLIEAFNGLDTRAALDIYKAPGASPTADYEEHVRRLTQHSGIRFRGICPPEQIMKVLSGLDVLVVPSISWETAPTVVLEAFAAGVPVIGTDVGGIPERVQHFCNGLLVPMGDVGALRVAMQRLLDTPELLATLKKSIPPVKAMEQHVEELLSVYRDFTDLKTDSFGRPVDSAMKARMSVIPAAHV